MSFIKRLDELLKEKGVSAHKMSLDLGLSKSAVTAWRDRGNIPTGDVLQKMADYFGVSVDYLLGRSDERNLITKHAASTVDDTQYDDLPEEAIQEMETFRQFLKEKYKKK